MSKVNSSKSSSKNQKGVFSPSAYNDGVYESSHDISNMNMTIRREDTRHGGKSEVTITRNTGKTVSMSLSEARSLKAFLDRELAVLAR